MSLGFCLVLFLGIASSQRCLPVYPPQHGTVSCLGGNATANCASNPPAGTSARFACEEFYRLEGRGLTRCREDGSWSSDPPKCIPDCGRRSGSVSLIVNGVAAPRGAYPWHVAIYISMGEGYEYWCGGSLVSPKAVITAAHCTWGVPPENLMLVFGKFHREYNHPEESVQKIKAERISILDSYQDVSGNYNGDIAVVVLEEAVALGHYSAPVCIDWYQGLSDRHLSEGSSGVVLGWGLTENGTVSEVLRAVSLPAVSARKCIAEQEEDFRKFVTCTSFCAGFRTGVGVCNGDSGGGLTFFDEVSGRWYIQGVVSVSPRRRGSSLCDPNRYAVFTTVGMFSKWLKTVVADWGDDGRSFTQPPF